MLKPGVSTGSELVLGPWSHGGIVDQSVGQDSSFDQPKHSVAFVNRCCDHTPSSRSQSAASQAAQDPTQHSQQQAPTLVADADVDGRASQHDRHQLGSVQSLAADEPANGRSQQQPHSKEAEDAASPSVHFFMMGDASQRGWKACHSWPPPGASSPPVKLYLSKAATPMLKPSRSWFWRSSKKAANAEQPKVAHTHVAQKPKVSHSQQAWSPDSISHDQLQMPHAVEQKKSARELNPAPVPANPGHTQVTQVVGSSKKAHVNPGQLSQQGSDQNCRFRHDIHLDKHPKV